MWVDSKAEGGGDFRDNRDVSDTQPKEATQMDENSTNLFIQEANNLKRG
jgi:hypothetical protein